MNERRTIQLIAKGPSSILDAIEIDIRSDPGTKVSSNNQSGHHPLLELYNAFNYGDNKNYALTSRVRYKKEIRYVVETKSPIEVETIRILAAKYPDVCFIYRSDGYFPNDREWYRFEKGSEVARFLHQGSMMFDTQGERIPENNDEIPF